MFVRLQKTITAYSLKWQSNNQKGSCITRAFDLNRLLIQVSNKLLIKGLFFAQNPIYLLTPIALLMYNVHFKSKESLMEKSIGSQLAAMRKPKERVCPVCGTSFITVGRGVYCSSSCKCRAANKLRRAKKD
jgi:hypothetical protein